MQLPMPNPHSYAGSNIRHNQERIFPWEQEAEKVIQIYKPKCIVLDLDFTLWPTFFSAHTSPPYVPLNCRPSQLLCVDKTTQKPRMLSLYPEVQRTIQFCLHHDIMISVASKNSNKEDAEAILRSLGIWHHLQFPQIFQNRKTYHFRNLKSMTHFAYEDFMFFDDDVRNVTVCKGIGVNSYRVDRGAGFNGKLLVNALKDCALKYGAKTVSVSQAPGGRTLSRPLHRHGQRKVIQSLDGHGHGQGQGLGHNGSRLDTIADTEEDIDLPDSLPLLAHKVDSAVSVSVSISSTSSSDDCSDGEDAMFCINDQEEDAHQTRDREQRTETEKCPVTHAGQMYI